MKAVSILIMLCLLAMIFSSPPASSEIVNNEIFQFTCQGALSGWSDGVTMWTNSQLISVEGNAGTVCSYLSFDTSSLADDISIYSATLYVRYVSRSGSPMVPDEMHVYNENYGAALTMADYPPALLSMDNTDYFCNEWETYQQWMISDLNPLNIDPTGRSQYIIAFDHDNAPLVNSTFWGPGSLSKPYLIISTGQDYGINLEYVFNPSNTIMGNSTIKMQPHNIEDYGTSVMAMYEFCTLWGTDFINVTTPSDTYILTSIMPFWDWVTNSTTTLYLIEPTVQNITVQLWFSIPKVMECQVHISLFRESTGEGIGFETWRTYINDGSVTNTTLMTNVTNPDILLNIGSTYTISIYDYFPVPNFITNYTFTTNDLVMTVDIPVPYGPLNFKSFRLDFTAFRIWFSGNTSVTPFQDHIPPEEWYPMLVRGGNYMIALDYLQTTINGTASILATYYLNVSINSSVAYSIKITNSSIQTIITLVNGANIQIANLFTAIGTEPVAWNLTDPIFSIPDTRSPGGVYTIVDEPFLIILSTAEFIRLDTTVGATTLWAGEIKENLMYGHWSYISDTLTVSASNTSAQMRVNDTTLAGVLVSSTAPAGATYDIYTNNLTSAGNNITVWVANGGFSVRREIEFRWAREVTWTYDGSSEYSAFVTLNNSLQITLRSPEVMITFPELQDPNVQVDTNRIYLFDTDHNVYLSPYSNYTRNSDRISWGMSTISPSTLQHYKVTFYTDNQTRQGTEYIEPVTAPDWFSYKGRTLRMVEGDYTNGQPSVFEGNIVFLMTSDEAKDVDTNSIIVIDNTTGTELIKNSDYRVNGDDIEIFPSFVGSMHTGDTISIRVVYLTDETAGISEVTADTILGIPVWLMGFLVLIPFGLIASALILSKKSGRSLMGRQLGALLITLGVIWALIMFIMATVGAIPV